MVTFDFKGKIVLVTGSSRGIGKAAASMFANGHAEVIVHYHADEEAARDSLIKLKGDHHSMFKANLADPNETKKLVDFCIEKYGRIDILVNNAGVFEELTVLELDYEKWQTSWQNTIQTNLTGVANLSFLVAKAMKDQGGCRIVNVSSRGAFRGEPDAPAYGASKAGLNSLGQSMAKAFAPYNIYVFTVAPGFVDTDMAATAMVGDRAAEIMNQSPLNRISSPEEIAQVICFLASEGHDYMTGCIVDINGASYLRT
ncbi:MAG: SDR family oxidoreductase [Bacteroidetes bacterium]|nr:SDR family oxidoreductase [Bacteroidota bacterium]